MSKDVEIAKALGDEVRKAFRKPKFPKVKPRGTSSMARGTQGYEATRSAANAWKGGTTPSSKMPKRKKGVARPQVAGDPHHRFDKPFRPWAD